MPNGVDRRQHIRVDLPGGLRGSVRGADEIRVINLSPVGAMIEHAEQFSLGETRILALQAGGMTLRLPAHIVWSQLYSGQAEPPERPRFAFRSGLHFGDLPREVQDSLRKYLATLGTPRS